MRPASGGFRQAEVVYGSTEARTRERERERTDRKRWEKRIGSEPAASAQVPGRPERFDGREMIVVANGQFASRSATAALKTAILVCPVAALASVHLVQTQQSTCATRQRKQSWPKRSTLPEAHLFSCLPVWCESGRTSPGLKSVFYYVECRSVVVYGNRQIRLRILDGTRRSTPWY